MTFHQLKEDYEKLSHSIYFDEHKFLREQTNDPEKCREYIKMVENKLHLDWSLTEKYFLYGALGYVYRVLNEAEKAIHYFEKCLKIIDSDDVKKKIVTLIRLGESYKYAEQQQQAFALFDEAWAISVNEGLSGYEDFIYQHKGKCLMELGKWALAEVAFNHSLEIRKQKGDIELIASTQKALNYIQLKRNTLPY